MFEQNKFFYRNQTNGTFKKDATTKLEWGIIKERSTPRNSISSTNVMLYVASKWKDYPDRRYSYFASQNIYSRFDGDSYLIIPADNVNLFGFSELDFNIPDNFFGTETIHNNHNRDILKGCSQGMRKIYDELKELNKADFNPELLKVCDKYNFDFSIPFNKVSINELPLFFKFIDELISVHPFKDHIDLSEELTNLQEHLKKYNYKDIVDLINDSSPELHGVKSYKNIKDIPYSNTGDEEIWFVGSYLAINTSDGTFGISGEEIIKQLHNILNIKS